VSGNSWTPKFVLGDGYVFNVEIFQPNTNARLYGDVLDPSNDYSDVIFKEGNNQIISDKQITISDINFIVNTSNQSKPFFEITYERNMTFEHCKLIFDENSVLSTIEK
jgi:hypothetical protein